MKKIILFFLSMVLGMIPSMGTNISVQTVVCDAYSQPPVVGGVIGNYDDSFIAKKGIIVSVSNDNLFYDTASETTFPYYWTGQGDPSVADIVYSTQDFRIIDCSGTGIEQFWTPLLFLKSQKDYYVRAYAVMTDGDIIYGQTESVHSQAFSRYNGRTDYANVYRAYSSTLFDLVTDEIINPAEGFYYSSTEQPKTVKHKVGISSNTSNLYYKFLTEWNYQLWYYHSKHCEQGKIVSLPLMSFSDNQLTIEKNALDADKDITLYYSVNGDFFRPETFTDIYTEPIEISEPCTVCCYAISTDGYISYTNMYVIYSLQDVEEYRSFDLTISDAGMSTLYLDYPVDVPDDDNLIAVLYVNKIEDHIMWLKKVKDHIPTNTGVIVQANPVTITFPETTHNVAAITDNQLTGVTESTPISSIDGTVYTLGRGRNSGYLGFFKYTGANLPANKAFMVRDTSSGVNGFNLVLDNEDGTSTAIGRINEDGEFVPESSVIYDLQGRRMENPTKGIHIVNGKKQYIK